MTITAENLVSREVFYCVSSLVSTLAGRQGSLLREVGHAELYDLTNQAFELASPIEDWESPAEEESWTGPYKDEFGATYFQCGADKMTWAAPDWQSLCEEFDIEPYQREVFEHWIVSDWLADKLAEKGEKVDKDFAGLTIWARTTTGQGIAQDWVIQQITNELHAA